MTIRLRQVALVAHDLAAAERAITDELPVVGPLPERDPATTSAGRFVLAGCRVRIT